MKKSLFCLLVWMALGPAVSFAAFDYRYDNKADVSGDLESSSAEKATRGFTNLLFGWMEIAQTPARMSAGIEHGPVTSFLIGLPYGIVRFATREVVGIYEILTFYAPQSPIMRPLTGEWG